MDLKDYAALAGIASILIGGANFVIIALARTFWKLTFEANKDDMLKKISTLENDFEKLEKKVDDHEDKNQYFRHNFESVTKGLMSHITTELAHLTEVMELKFKYYFGTDSKDKPIKSNEKKR